MYEILGKYFYNIIIDLQILYIWDHKKRQWDKLKMWRLETCVVHYFLSENLQLKILRCTERDKEPFISINVATELT